jgi:hypothetical protein
LSDHLQSPHIATPALDEFLSGALPDLPRFLTSAESMRSFRAAALEGGEAAQDPSLQPALRISLWRFARVLCHAAGTLSEDETLEDALADARPDPWTQRLRCLPTPTQRALLRAGGAGIVYGSLSTPEGLPLLPPRDGRAAGWCELFSHVAHACLIQRSPRGPDCLAVLENPDLAVLVEVTAPQVERVEELMVDQAQRVLVRHGERGVADHFRERYGLSRREALGLISLARADSLKYGRSSVEDDRALMVAVLKDYLDRARESMNMGDEIRAIRELARVQGLTRTEPENVAAEFLGVVRRVAGRQEALQLAPAAAEALDVDFEEVEELEVLGKDLPTDRDSEEKAELEFDAAEAVE